MARNRIEIPAPVDDVFAVLADAHAYARWVVGAKTIRGTEGDWPAPGAMFHHSVGIGPLKVNDSTKVVELDPPQRLVLEARARPFGVASVRFTLTPSATGTVVVMEEQPLRPWCTRVTGMALDPLTTHRNAVSLERLKHIALERQGSPPPGA